MTIFARAIGRPTAAIMLLHALHGGPSADAAPAGQEQSVGRLNPIASNGSVTGKVFLRARPDDIREVTLTLVSADLAISHVVTVDEGSGTFSALIPPGTCKWRPCSISATVSDHYGDTELRNSPQTYSERSLPVPEPVYGLNLTNRCVASPAPELENAYVGREECEGGPTWTLALQAERELGVSCSGPSSQSLPVNAPGSPATFRWLPLRERGDGAPSTAYLRINTVDTPHPCGNEVFTWFALIDHVVHNGGPLPPPSSLQHQVTLRYTDRVFAGSHRIVIGASFFWDGRHHMVDLQVASPGWSPREGLPAGIINQLSTEAYTYLHVDGARYGHVLQRGETTTFSVNWTYILHLLISQGVLPPPSGGMAAAATGSISVGIETINRATANAVEAELWISDWKVTEVTGGPGPSG